MNIAFISHNKNIQYLLRMSQWLMSTKWRCHKRKNFENLLKKLLTIVRTSVIIRYVVRMKGFSELRV